MKKFLFVYIPIFQNMLFGCAMCQFMIPTAEITIGLDIKQKHF